MTSAAPPRADSDDGTGTVTVTGEVLASWPADADHTPLVLDVRSAAEYDAIHIRGSYHLPLPTLAEHTDELAGHLAGSGPVVLVCQSGVRAEQARRHLAAVGLPHARVLAGGISAFVAAGGQVVRGRRAWSLDRQVRLVAGALGVTGLTAGRLVSPKARLLATGIGAGLTLSALTDTCAMGAALARMPWNRNRSEPTASEGLRRVARRTPEG